MRDDVRRVPQVEYTVATSDNFVKALTSSAELCLHITSHGTDGGRSAPLPAEGRRDGGREKRCVRHQCKILVPRARHSAPWYWSRLYENLHFFQRNRHV